MKPDTPAAVRSWPVRAMGWAGLLFSVLLHLLVVVLLVLRVPPPPPEHPDQVEVQVVPEPEPEARPKPEPPPEPKPEPKPEPPKPEPKPEPKAEQKPLSAKIEPAKPKPAPPPVPPKPAVQPKPVMQLPGPPVRGTPVAPLNLGEHALDEDGLGLASGFDASTSQTIRDMMLTQVIRHWRPPPAVRGHNWGVRFTVEVSASGMLGAPFAANRPLDINIAVAGYDSLPPELKPTLYDLVQALRVAQPFTLPEAVLAKAPFAVRLDFGFDQIP